MNAFKDGTPAPTSQLARSSAFLSACLFLSFNVRLPHLTLSFQSSNHICAMLIK